MVRQASGGREERAHPQAPEKDCPPPNLGNGRDYPLITPRNKTMSGPMASNASHAVQDAILAVQAKRWPGAYSWHVPAAAGVARRGNPGAGAVPDRWAGLSPFQADDRRGGPLPWSATSQRCKQDRGRQNPIQGLVQTVGGRRNWSTPPGAATEAARHGRDWALRSQHGLLGSTR